MGWTQQAVRCRCLVLDHNLSAALTSIPTSAVSITNLFVVGGIFSKFCFFRKALVDRTILWDQTELRSLKSVVRIETRPRTDVWAIGRTLRSGPV